MSTSGETLTVQGTVRERVTQSRLVIGLASVFVGIAAFVVVLALALRMPFLFVVAAPFGLTGILMWYHGTGRLEARVRRSAANGRTGGGRRGGERLGGGRREPRGRSPAGTAGLSVAEAYRVLGLDPGADEDAVRRAYRRKAKEVHPDADGDRAAFERVNDAYDRLTEGA